MLALRRLYGNRPSPRASLPRSARGIFVPPLRAHQVLMPAHPAPIFPHFALDIFDRGGGYTLFIKVIKIKTKIKKEHHVSPQKTI